MTRLDPAASKAFNRRQWQNAAEAGHRRESTIGGGGDKTPYLQGSA
jgi:hypothetical protein